MVGEGLLPTKAHQLFDWQSWQSDLFRRAHASPSFAYWNIGRPSPTTDQRIWLLRLILRMEWIR